VTILYDTDRTIPSDVQVRNRLLNIDQIREVAVREEEKTYPIRNLKGGEIEFSVEGNTCTFMTLKNVPPRVNTAEAYINVIHGLRPELESSVGNNLLAWAVVCESEDLTRSIIAEIKFPKKVSNRVDVRVKGIESDEVKRFCKEHELGDAICDYTGIVCDVLTNATRIKISLSSDPEIGNREKIRFSISFESNSNVEAILELDEKLSDTINATISTRDSDYFVKTYDLNG